MNILKSHTSWWILFFSILLFVPFLGAVHLFDWDEINFAECAREMLETNNYLNLQMNYLPFWEKPPLFIWISALCMKMFGVNEFAARFPNAMCGIFTLLILFKIGRKIYNEKLGIIWVLCYAGSTLPQFYFKTGIIDPWFNLFIFSSLYFVILFTYPNKENSDKKISYLIFSAILLGLAVLTKGPAAIIIIGLCFIVYLFLQKFKPGITWWQLLLYMLITLIVGGLWFLLLILNGQFFLIEKFISYQAHLFNSEDAGHGGPFYYHFIVLLVGCFPSSVFALFAFKNTEEALPKHFKKWLLILFWVVLILFSIVETKIIHYSSLCYFPLSFLSAQWIYQFLYEKKPWKKSLSYLIIFVGSLFSLVLIVIAFADKFKTQIINSGMIHDDFALENFKAEVAWNGSEFLIGLLLLCVTITAVFLRLKKPSFAIAILFLGNLLSVQLTGIFIIPKIEQYTQGAAIEFYESCQNKPNYCVALNYHSYAQYFYTKKAPPTKPQSLETDWLLRGEIDKDVRIISKINSKTDVLNAYPYLEVSGSKNGYVFYIRKAHQ